MLSTDSSMEKLEIEGENEEKGSGYENKGEDDSAISSSHLPNRK
jgi:hypothetical protein